MVKLDPSELTKLLPCGNGINTANEEIKLFYIPKSFILFRNGDAAEEMEDFFFLAFENPALYWEDEYGFQSKNAVLNRFKAVASSMDIHGIDWESRLEEIIGIVKWMGAVE